MANQDYIGDNVSPEHRAKFKGNLWIWVLAATVGFLCVAIMALDVVGDKI